MVQRRDSCTEEGSWRPALGSPRAVSERRSAQAREKAPQGWEKTQLKHQSGTVRPEQWEQQPLPSPQVRVENFIIRATEGNTQKGFASETGQNCVLCAQSRRTLCGPMDCVARQAPQLMEFSRQEYWNGVFLLQGNLPNPGIKPLSLAFSCIGRWLLYHCTSWEAQGKITLRLSVALVPASKT